MLFRLFSKEKGERWRRQFSVVCGFDLRLWLWSVEILKYFLGTPSPKLPIGTNVFSKMKTLNKEVEAGTRGLGHQVRMVSSTGSVESAWLASFFRDRRLHSFSTSRLATSRILERACGEDGQEETASENLTSGFSKPRQKRVLTSELDALWPNLTNALDGSREAEKTTHHPFHVLRRGGEGAGRVFRTLKVLG